MLTSRLRSFCSRMLSWIRAVKAMPTSAMPTNPKMNAVPLDIVTPEGGDADAQFETRFRLLLARIPALPRPGQIIKVADLKASIDRLSQRELPAR
jgi:hypothetical protein